MEIENINPQYELLKKVANCIDGVTIEDMFKWASFLTNDGMPPTMFYMDAGVPHCIYTDGDGGIMLFSAMCEIFEEQGMMVQTIGCTHCDIPFGLMSEIDMTLSDMEVEYSEDEE